MIHKLYHKLSRLCQPNTWTQHFSYKGDRRMRGRGTFQQGNQLTKHERSRESSQNPISPPPGDPDVPCAIHWMYHVDSLLSTAMIIGPRAIWHFDQWTPPFLAFQLKKKRTSSPIGGPGRRADVYSFSSVFLSFIIVIFKEKKILILNP